MSEGFMIDGPGGQAAGIVVRLEGERGFRFHAAIKAVEALDGHVFPTPAAAQRASSEFLAFKKRGQKSTAEAA
jgi:hypothetical protein